MLKTPEFADAQQPPPEEATGTSRSPGELLMTGSGYQNVITTDLVDDPMLTDSNIENFKKAYDLAMVRPKCFPVGEHCRVAYRNLPPYAECDHPLPDEIRKAESRCEWSPRASPTKR
jgi:hypothetical protein